MSNGYLLAAEADLAAVHDIGEGFGLVVIGATSLGDHEAAATTLASAANVGIVLSTAAASDANYVALLQALGERLLRTQLLVADADARAAFTFLPSMWPVMSLDEARMRANAMLQQRQPAPAPVEPPPPVAEPEPQPTPESTAPEPAPHTPEPEPTPEYAAPEPDAPLLESEVETRTEEPEEQAADQKSAEIEDALSDGTATGGEGAPGAADDGDREESFAGGAPDENARAITLPREDEAPPASHAEEAPAPPPQTDEPIAAAPPPRVDEPEEPAPPPMAGAPAPAPSIPPPQAQAPEPPSREQRDEGSDGAADSWQPPLPRKRSASGAVTAPADATAFAPKKLRRATPELVRIVIHQPKDLNAVIKAARKIDARAEPAPQGMSIGEVALGSSVGVSLEVRGASCDGTVQRRTWNGDPIDFSFSVEADQGVKQAVILARVFVDDAQIGILAFTRNITGPSKKPASDGDRVRLKRHKRVFLSYSSKDREVVAAIATAYDRAGVEYFWDRSSLKSGEEWSPRLRKEIERADLFHLCWSKSAAGSEWVQKEAEHALTRRKRNSGKPEITVQMLDGPPWAPHPDTLDSINFDDFVRAAIVGYARGDA